MNKFIKIIILVFSLTASYFVNAQQSETAKGQKIMSYAQNNCNRFISKYGGKIISSGFNEEYKLSVPYSYETVIQFSEAKSYDEIKGMASKFYGTYTNWKTNYLEGEKYHYGTFCSYNSKREKIVEYDYVFFPSDSKYLIITTHPDY